MKYAILPIALMVSMISVAEDGWVAVGQKLTAEPVTSEAIKTLSNKARFSSGASGNSTLQLEMLTMTEAMQQEIAELRGLVEEQSHTIEQLKKQQQQRYLDLDRRIVELTTSPVSSNAIVNKDTAKDQDGMSPDDLYASAMSNVKSKDFTAALSQFDLLIKTYPQHTLAGNSLYWAGEVQLAEGQLDESIQYFLNVVTNYPNHLKAPDSNYKLAVAYERNGKLEQAKKTLRQVITLYEGSSHSVVKLAKDDLKRLGSL